MRLQTDDVRLWSSKPGNHECGGQRVRMRQEAICAFRLDLDLEHWGCLDGKVNDQRDG